MSQPESPPALLLKSPGCQEPSHVSARVASRLIWFVPLPDEWSDGSLNACVADPNPCLARTFHRVPPPPHTQANPRQEKRTAGPRSGLRKNAYRVQVALT